MESTRDIKGRIKSVTNIQQITKAMKMVAAARLRKAEEKAKGSLPYAEKIGELMRRASSATPDFDSPLLDVRESKKVGYLVICGDKGLAGAYNSNVMKRTIQEISGKDPSTYKLFVCGKQAKKYLNFRGYKTDSYHFGFSDKPQASNSIELSEQMIQQFSDEEVDEGGFIVSDKEPEEGGFIVSDEEPEDNSVDVTSEEYSDIDFEYESD